jgi:hypothetical protein
MTGIEATVVQMPVKKCENAEDGHRQNPQKSYNVGRNVYVRNARTRITHGSNRYKTQLKISCRNTT